MAVTINAKGTSVSSFAIGKNGTLITQAGAISPPAANDLSLSAAAGQSIFLTVDTGELEVTSSAITSNVNFSAPNFTGSTSGTNTGDQTITLTGDVTGSGTGSFAATLSTTGVSAGTFAPSSITVDAKGRITAIVGGGGGGGSVTSVAVSGNNGIGVSGSPITTSGTITLSLGAITPTSVASSGTVTGTNLSGTNTGDQTITLTGDVTGTGTGSFGTTLATVNGNVGTFGTASSVGTFTVNGKGLITAASNTSIQIAETQITDGALLARVNDNETITGNWTFNNVVVGVDPVASSNFATKQYVDNAVNGLKWKSPVIAATTANITLSAPQTIDGIGVVAGNRVLVKNQTASEDNGIYIVAAGAWTRAPDFDSLTPIDEVNGAAVFVLTGTTQGDTSWVETSTVTTIGTDPIVFVQFSGAGAYVAGAGLTLTGNTFAVGTASASRIVVNVDDIDLATVTDSGTGTFLKLTRDSYGRVSGTTAVVAGDITPLVDGTYVNVTGDSMSGSLTITRSVDALTTLISSTNTNSGTSAQALHTINSDTAGLSLGTNSSTYVTTGAYGVANETFLRPSVASSGLYINTGASVPIRFGIGGTERLRLDSSGNLLLGQTTTYTTSGFTANQFQIASTGGSAGFTSSVWPGAATTGTDIQFLKSRGAAIGTNGIVASGDNIAQLVFAGDDGANFIPAASITALIDGTPGTNDMPGRLVFNTTADGASAVTEAMRIDNQQRVGIGGTPSGGSLGDKLYVLHSTTSTSSTTMAYKQFNVAATSGSGTYTASNSLLAPTGAFAGTGILLGTNSAITTAHTGTVADARLYGSSFTTTGGGTVTSLSSYLASGLTLTSGSVTNHYGFRSSSAMTGATNNYGFVGEIASGSNRWNIYMGGTADNYFAGNIGVGTQTPSYQFDLQGTGGSPMALTRFSNTASSTSITMAHSRGATVGSNVIVQNNDILGSILFSGANGTGYDTAAAVRAEVDGTPGASSDMPGRLLFMTTPDGSATLSERMRIDNAGNVLVNRTTSSGLGVFQVSGVSDIAGANSSSAYGTGEQTLYLRNTSTTANARGAGVRFDWGTNTGGAAQIDLISIGTNGGTLSFGTRPTAGSMTERMTIGSAGNVTINTPGSGAALAVNGIGNATIVSVSDGTRIASIGTDTSNGTVFVGAVTNHGLDFYTNGTQKARISAAGNMIINSPTSGNTLTVEQSSVAAVGIQAVGFQSFGPSTVGNTISDLNIFGSTLPRSVIRYDSYNSTATNKPVTADNANGVVSMVSHPTGGAGVYGKQLAFANTDELYMRSLSNGTYGSWRQLLWNGMSTNVTFTGTVDAVSFNATSTKRVKKAIKNITQATVDKFSQLKPREYDRKDYAAHEFGFIAEEMALVYPEVVGKDTNGKPTGIDYGKLSTILTAKVQEQQKVITKLQEQMEMVLGVLKGKK